MKNAYSPRESFKTKHTDITEGSIRELVMRRKPEGEGEASIKAATGEDSDEADRIRAD